MNNRKIHIYYRDYNITNETDRIKIYRPINFSFLDCYNCIKNTICDDIKFNVVFDGDIRNFRGNKEDRIIPINAGSDKQSFFISTIIVKKDIESNIIGDNDLIYFLENDYLHVENWSKFVFDFYSNYIGDVNNVYLSLYDHYDKYTPRYSELASKLYVTKYRHWRTTPSTCGSFIISKDLFLKDYDILSTVEGDHNKFILLGEKRGRTVISPIPGLSTHCMNGLLSPTINWYKIGDIN